MKYTTTLNRLLTAKACAKGYNKLTAHLQGHPHTTGFIYGDRIPHDYDLDAIIPMTTILNNNGIDDALWALRAVREKEEARKDARIIATRFCESVLDYAPAQYRGVVVVTLASATDFANGDRVVTGVALEAARKDLGRAICKHCETAGYDNPGYRVMQAAMESLNDNPAVGVWYAYEHALDVHGADMVSYTAEEKFQFDLILKMFNGEAF